MKTMLNHKTVFFIAAMLFMNASVFAQGLVIPGNVPRPQAVQKASWSDQMKSGFGKITKAILPGKEEPQKIDELSLSRKAKSSPGLHVALAKSCEQNGQTQKAIIEYEKALKLNPNHEGTLLQYARFCDRINKPEHSEKLFKRAVQKHPRSAKVFNHQGLFFVRHNQFSEAVHAFATAVALEPLKESYRGNLAVVLVDLGREGEAYQHLRKVQSPDTAYYNLGYLLQERGKKTLAMKHFQVALQKNPDHKEARIWFQYLLAEQQNSPPQRIAAEVQMPHVPPQQTPPRQPQLPQRPPQQTSQDIARVQPGPRIERQPLIDSNPMPPTPTVRVQQTPPSIPLAMNQPMNQQPPHKPIADMPTQSSVTPQAPPKPPWQPRIPENTITPVRTHSYYRSTIPPGRQQPYAVPAPGYVGANDIQQRQPQQRPVTPPSQVDPNRRNPALDNRAPAMGDRSNAKQPEPPSLVTPSGNTTPIRRLPAVTSRRTVHASTDRYITPLPPVDWSDNFKPGQ